MALDQEAHVFRDATQVLRAEIPSRLDRREALIAEVLAALEKAGEPVDPFADRLVLDEAITNAILHGNRQDAAKRVAVRVLTAKDGWAVEVEDEGPGFDWRATVERARTCEDQNRPSGRGLLLILASGLEAHFLDGGRRLLLVRKRARKG